MSVNTNKPAPDEALILEAITALFDDDQIVELRAFPKGRGKRTDSGYFDGDHRAELAHHAAVLNRTGAPVYVTLNTVDPQLLGRYANRIEQYALATTTGANIRRRRWLLIDLDPERPKDTAATDVQLAAAKASAIRCAEWLDGKGWPAPTDAESGNGMHLLYPVDLPNDEATTSTIKAVLEAIGKQIDNDMVKVDRAVFDANRITKLYGTVATKGDPLPMAPHRLSRILNAPGRDALVTIEQLQGLIGIDQKDPKPRNDTPRKSAPKKQQFNLYDFLARLGIEYTEGPHSGADRFLLACCPFNPEHGKGEAAIFRRKDGALGFKCQHDTCGARHWKDVRELVDGPQLQRGAGSTNAEPPASSIDSDDSVTEDAVALEFSARHANRLRWVQDWSRWLRWDGMQWAPDRTVVTMDMARKLCRELAGGDEKRARVMRQAPFISAVERLARSDRRHAATPEEFDAGDFLLNTPDGIVDLATGAIIRHDPARYLTKISRAGINGECPTWRKFLIRITSGDAELQAFLQRIAGYSLTGSVREHALFFFYGTGANGKSTFLDLLTWILGDYGTVAAMEAFTASQGDRHPADLAALRGARLVTASETEQGRRWDEARIKVLTGGDPITARFMRGDFFTYAPSFKVVIAGNHRPQLRSVDQAMRRRLHLVPFTAFIKPEERDPDLQQKLRAEAGGIMRWAIAGCAEWQRSGLNPPAAVVSATDEYLQTQDRLAAWIEDCCEVSANYWALPAVLFSSWTAWGEKAGEYVGTQSVFGDRLEAAGFRRNRTHGVRQFVGLRLRVPENVQAGPWERRG